MKIGDVYRFHWKPGQGPEGDAYWCFDGKLIVRETRDGGLILVDTYWGSGDNRTFTPERAQEQGELTLLFNLDDVEQLGRYESPHYYAPEDVFEFHHQHGCYQRWMKRKGAARCRDTILAEFRRRLEDAHKKADSAVRAVEWAARDLQRAEIEPDLSKILL